MERGLGADVQTEDPEGGLREVVLRWFTETQETLILHNGKYPSWFRGFTARTDAEDMLRDKTMGSFLIRLSDKVLGYILSYKGQSRCRHFVINQNNSGWFVLEGDRRSHHSLKELIAHYKFSPIEPYGEYLTSCCCETKPSDLYDMVRFETQEKSVSVQVLKAFWNQKCDKSSSQNSFGKIIEKPPQQNIFLDVRPPTLPSTTKTRKLTSTVSVDPVSQEAPPVPKRGPPLSHSLSKSLIYASSDYSQIKTNAMDPQKRESARATTLQQLSDVPNVFTSRLPSLDRDTGQETPMVMVLTSNYAQPQKNLICPTYSLHNPRDIMKHHGKIEHEMDHHDILQPNPIYQPSVGPDGTLAHLDDTWYEEVPKGHTLVTHCSNDNPYEQIETSPSIQGNHYENLEDIKTKTPKFTMGKTNIKWPKFLPEHKKK